MPSVDILSPLNGHIVGSPFDVRVAYDFRTTILRSPVRISCTVAGATPVTPPPNPATVETGTSGEVTFSFLASVGVYTVNVTTDPPEYGSDQEENITVSGTQGECPKNGKLASD